MSLGQKLKELREGAALSQAELAKQVGVTRNAVSQWEGDKFAPETKHLVKIASIFGVPVDRLTSPETEVRQRILEYATRMFDRVGVEETSIESICAASDLTRAQFEQVYRAKEELLFDVLKGFKEKIFVDARPKPLQNTGLSRHASSNCCGCTIYMTWLTQNCLPHYMPVPGHGMTQRNVNTCDRCQNITIQCMHFLRKPSSKVRSTLGTIAQPLI